MAMRIATAATIHTPRRAPPCVGADAEVVADDGTEVTCEAAGCAAFVPEPGLGAELAAAHAPVEPLGAREESVSRFRRFKSPRSSAAI